jgi:hypothetical protein
MRSNTTVKVNIQANGTSYFDGGNVGIGTTSPADTSNFGRALDINGTTGAACYVRTNGSATNYGLIGHYGTDFYVNNNSNGPIRFFANGDERARIDSSGRLLVGTSTSLGDGAQVQSVSAIAQVFDGYNFREDNVGSELRLGKARGGSSSSPTILSSGDSIGRVIFRGHAGATSGFLQAAYIDATVDGTPGTNDMPGRLVFSTTADGASFPTERLRITSAGLVGIGTSSPGSQLQVNTGSAATVGQIIQLAASQTADILRVVRSDSNYSLQFTPSGQLSFGDFSSSPTTVITLGPSTSTNANLKITCSNVGNPNLLLQSMSGGGGSIGGPTSFVYFGDNNRALSYVGGTKINPFAANASSDLVFGTTPDISTTAVTERLRITSSGLVGIGTTSPGTYGGFAVRIASGGTSGSFSDGTTGSLHIDHASNIISLRCDASNLAFQTSSTERARIDSSGRLLVGTSSASGANLLQVNSDALVNGLTVGRGASNDSNTAVLGNGALAAETGGTGNVAIGRQAVNSLTTGSYNIGVGYLALSDIVSNSGSIMIGGVTSTGSYSPASNITASDRISIGSTSVTDAFIQVAWTVVSDARDKTNFSPVPHGLDFVTALKPTAFQFKLDRESSQPNGRVRYGFKAQDILELEGENGIIINSENPEKLYYNGESLIPVLVNAIKELSAKNTALEARLTAAGID